MLDCDTYLNIYICNIISLCMMRILYIFRSLAVWGGIERVLVDKMNCLVSMYGYEVYMLTTCQGNHPVPYQLDNTVHMEDLGVQFHRQYQYRGFKKLWDGWKRTKRFERLLSERIKTIRPDVIICTTADSVNSIVKVKGDTPLIVESHSICKRTLGEKGLRQRYVARLLLKGLKKAAYLVSLSEGDANEWRKLGVSVKVIPNIVHLNEGELSDLEQKHVIFVGRFDYQKRPMAMIQIWKELFPRHQDWHLDIYGEGEQKQTLQSVIGSQNMNIHLHEPTIRIFEAYRNSSILVVTSLYEPFGLVIPEAMSCGLPVVSFDSPYGPSSVITNGKDGYLVENDNNALFAKQLEQLMDDVSLRLKMGTYAVEKSKRFSAQEIMPEWKDLFDCLASA